MTDSFRIKGGNTLRGNIVVGGSKNAATKLVAATLLTSKKCILRGLPRIRDVEVMLDILVDMGARIERRGNATHIHNQHIDPGKLSYEKCKRVRSSIIFLGPLLARFGKAELPYPGGDPIGTRSIETHLNAFEDFGLRVKRKKNSFSVVGSPKVGVKKIILDEFSVTATENVLMYAASLSRSFELSIVAEEPHVQSLTDFLNDMGAQVSVLPYHKIRIHGKKVLKGVDVRIRPDYIEAGTFVCAVLAVGGDVRIHNFPIQDLELFLHRLRRAGARIDIESAQVVRVRTSPGLALHKIQTMIYPGVPTDLQSPLGVLATQTQGTTFLHDPMYEGRLAYLKELRKMGAAVTILDPHRAEIRGPTKLHGVSIAGKDIRGGMSLIIAALAARGVTTLRNAYQVDRGYEKIDERLRGIGADIERVT